jgi:AbrB family looped-hinge helix DNA binding protein
MNLRAKTTVSKKGQVVLPKAIRDSREWTAGTQLIVEDRPEGVLLKPMPQFIDTTIDAVFGSLKHAGPAITLENMDKAIAREAKRRARKNKSAVAVKTL